MPANEVPYLQQDHVGGMRAACRSSHALGAEEPAMHLRISAKLVPTPTGSVAMNTPRTVVIVGGVAAGMSAATRLRRNDEDASIVIFERGTYVSFANCGLAYHLGGQIPERDALLLHSPDELQDRFRLDIRTRHEVIEIDRVRKQVHVRDLTTGQTHAQPYDALILATGAKPISLKVPGTQRALPLRSIEDMDRINDLIKLQRPRHAAVIGAGFIGLELAENLRLRGLEVALVEAGPQVLPPLDPELASLVASRLEAASVKLHLDSAATTIGPDTVELSNGTTLPADLVVSAIGVTPESKLAVHCGLAVGSNGGIEVDDSGRTSDPDIYAVGDAAYKLDTVDSSPMLIPLANTANRHGRLVADAICGKPIRLRPALGTAIVEVFGLTAATVGWNEKRLAKAGKQFQAVHSHPNAHVTYFPGAERLSIKLLFDPETLQILGAQAVGKQGVDKRIDVIATAMRAGLTVLDLADLELAYAPQFGAAKDPVNMLGMMAENIVTGDLPTVQWHNLDAELRQGTRIVDVREPSEFAAGSVPGALNIPLTELRARAHEIPGDRVVVMCAVGQRGNTATRLLRNLGYDATNLDGGYLTWTAAHYEPGARTPIPLAVAASASLSS